MSCPNDEQWDLLSMNVLDDATAEWLRRHLVGCQRCRERFERSHREHVALIESHEAFADAHDKLREQVIAALPGVPPHSEEFGGVRSGWLRLGDFVMQMNTTANRRAVLVLAPAACIALVLSVFWGWSGRSAFGEALRHLREAETIVCQVTVDVTTKMRHPDGTVAQTLDYHRTEKLYISADHGVRRDAYEDGAHVSTTFDPAGRDVVIVDHRNQRYHDFGAVQQSEAAAKLQDTLRDLLAERGIPELQFFGLSHDPDGLIQGLRQLTTEADRELGFADVEGAEAVGFGIAGEKIGFAPPVSERSEENRAELWVDTENNLPLKLVTRFVIEVRQIKDLPLSASFHMTATYDGFEFDVPLEPEWFDVVIPDGFEPGEDLDTAFTEVPDEAGLIEALRVFAEHAGRYPSTLQTTVTFEVSYLMGALQARHLKATRTGEGVDGLPDPKAIASKFDGLMFFPLLEAQGRQPMYFGKDVEPGDADSILLQWTLEDGRTRVIYGDLEAETRE